MGNPLAYSPNHPLADRFHRGSSDVVQVFRTSLKEAFGTRAAVDEDRLLVYSYDATSERHWPDAALLAGTMEDLQQAVKLAAKCRIPLIPRGSGSNLSGGTLPTSGGLVLTMAGMKKILDINLSAREVTVQPGVINAELQEALAQDQFFFPPDPASHRISSLGGNVAEGSGGPHCVKYGTTSHYVRSVNVILADGSRAEGPAGLTLVDWPGILTGSEGTLAILVEMTLGILPKPQCTGTMLAGFSSLPSAVTAVSAIIKAQIIPSTLELLDKATLDTVRPFIDAGYPDCEAVLLIEVDGSQQSVDAQEVQLLSLLQSLGAEPVELAHSSAQAYALMAARRSAYGAAARLSPHLWVQDVTVPRPKLAEMMAYVLEVSRTEHIPINTVAHAGDGNLHPLIPFNPENSEEVRRMKKADAAILQKAAALGGSITGEHGIGIDKLPSLPLMFTDAELSFMASVKRAFDPDGILNPGKAVYPMPEEPFRAVPPGTAAPDLKGRLEPETEEELVEVMRTLIATGTPWSLGDFSLSAARVSLARLKRITDFDPDNMTVSVQAGMTVGAMEEFLHSEDLTFPVKGLRPEQSLGSLVSHGLPHMLHMGYGPLKNWVLGLTIIDGSGRILRYGKKVMKNVAGFDMPKLYMGSLGRMGLITEVTLRVLPLASGTPAALSIDAGHLDPAVLESVAGALNRLSSGPQGLWVTGQTLWVYMEGPDLDQKTSQASRVLEPVCREVRHNDGFAAIADTRQLYREEHAARQRCGGIHYFGMGRPPGGYGQALYSQPGGGLWVSAAAPDPNSTQFFRSLDSQGWHFHGTLDIGLAKIQERLLAAADPTGLFAGLR